MKKQTLKWLGGLLAGTAALSSAPVQAGCATDPFIGSICATTASFCPSPLYLPASGAILPVSQHQALFSLIGSVYGGDGRTTFALPDLRGRTPVGTGRGVGLTGVQLGEQRGVETTTQRIDTMAAHSHDAIFTPSSGNLEVAVAVSTNTAGNQTAPGNGYSYLSASPGGPSSAAIWSNTRSGTETLNGVTTTGGSSGVVNVAGSGGGRPDINIPPQLGLTYCIAIDGTYPSRP